jgi:hypothetical protein
MKKQIVMQLAHIIVKSMDKTLLYAKRLSIAIKQAWATVNDVQNIGGYPLVKFNTCLTQEQVAKLDLAVGTIIEM